MAEPGVFLTVEGVDGTGKSTQVRTLAEAVVGRGREVVVTREPGGSRLGERIREIVLHHPDDVTDRAEALLYAADRAHHVATIVRPALARGAVVIADRYLDSSVAYQGVGRRLDAAEIRRLSLWAADGLLPDRTILLDADPGVALRRLRGRDGAPDRLEGAPADFHRRVREAFLELAAAEPARFRIVEADGSADAVAARVGEAVADVLPPAGRVGGHG